MHVFTASLMLETQILTLAVLLRLHSWAIGITTIYINIGSKEAARAQLHQPIEISNSIFEFVPPKLPSLKSLSLPWYRPILEVDSHSIWHRHQFSFKFCWEVRERIVIKSEKNATRSSFEYQPQKAKFIEKRPSSSLTLVALAFAFSRTKFKDSGAFIWTADIHNPCSTCCTSTCVLASTKPIIFAWPASSCIYSSAALHSL